jgi:hypothetical protein
MEQGMSQRSIIEINHDLSHEIDREGGRVIDLLLRALASGSDRYWEPLRRYGINRIVQCHHSEDRKLVVKDSAGERKYQIG